MGHTKPADLEDVASLLSQLEALPGVVQKKPGIFYRKSAGFLHFHDKDGVRWVDIKEEGKWMRHDLDFGASSSEQKKLLARAKKLLADK